MVQSTQQQNPSMDYSAQGNPINKVFPLPIVATRDPTSADVKFQIGQVWINKSTPSVWYLGSKASGVAVWVASGSGAVGGIVTITGDSGGAESPLAGDFSLLGTANQITVAGSANTETFSLSATLVAPGSIASTTTIAAGTTLTGGTGITATTGNIVASTGNITSTLGSVSAATTVTAGTGITATTGNIAASAGAVSASTTVTAGTDLVATAGNLLLNGAAKQIQIKGGAVTDFIGQATLLNGVATVLNTNLAATDRVFVSRSAKNASTAYGVFQCVVTAATSLVITSCKSDTTTETNDQSTVDYVIIRQL
jgi:trimeric autotransporter adhesin